MLKLSKLRFGSTLQEIKCSSSRNLTAEQLQTLADGNYINRCENVLISGPTGSGKSFLACALGNQACMLEFGKIALLILDDFGLQPLDQNTRLALLQILEDRYAEKSTMLVSQLPINQWHNAIGEPTLADAIMDRITSNAHRIELKGESLRKKSIQN